MTTTEQLQTKLELTLAKLKAERNIDKQISLYQDANKIILRMQAIKDTKASSAKIFEPVKPAKMNLNGNHYIGAWRW